MLKSLKNIIAHESLSACLLLFFTFLALLLSNSAGYNFYQTIVHEYISLNIFDYHFKTQLLHITNENLMTIFFLVVGLEIKHELLYGALNSFSKALLPGVAALGGMLVPALIYVVINYKDAIGLKGWAIPTATDIAFSLGVLTLLGSRVPKSLKILLMALAIFDDLAAIIVIAVFYTSQISWMFLGLALLCIGLLVILNIKNIQRLSIYCLLGILLWYCLTKAGIHSTLAGGILAFMIPASSAERLKHLLHPWVAFGILPLFAFANAGVSFMHISFADLEIPIVLGVFFGLFFGKQIGVFGLCWLAVKCRLCYLPEKLTWHQVYAMSVLCGIGFTISLFIGTLAFGDYSGHLDSVKISVLLASFLSAMLGGGLLMLNKKSCRQVSSTV